MIHFFYGDNDYAISQAVAKIVADFATKYGRDNVVNIDVASTEPVDVINQLTAVSLFSSNRLVVVKSLTDNQDNWVLLENNVGQIADGTDVVITDNKQTGKVKNLARTKTYKALQAADVDIKKFELLKQYDIRPWLQSEAGQRGLKFQGSALNYLIQQTAGEDNQQARLTIELDKLALLNRDITNAVIDEYVEPSPAINTFNIFTDAITGNKKRALIELRKLALLEDANKFLGLLASQEYALTAAILSSKVKINPYQLKKSVELARRLGNRQEQIAKIKRIAAIMSKLDGEIKLSRPDEAWVRIEAAFALL